MTDRFNLRVWDKVYEHYWKEEEVYLNIQWLLYPDNDNINNVEVEQCTGIHDRKGKLVYEGDLLRYCSIDGYIQAELFVVEDLRSFFFLLDREDPYYAVAWIEVVGNIHINENKEVENEKRNVEQISKKL